MDRGLMGFGRSLGLTETFENIIELETKLLNLDQFKEVKVKTAKSEEWEKKYKGVWNLNKNALAGVVSDKYMLIQHQEAFLPVLEVLRSTGLTDIEGRLDQNLKRAYLVINFKDPRTTMEIKYPDGRIDKVNLSLYMKHGVDGSLALWGTIGGFRIVCSNGMIVGNILGVSRKIHRGASNKNLIKKFYKDLIGSMVQSSEKLSDIIQRSFSEIIKSEILEALLYGAGFGRNYVKALLKKCRRYDEMYKWDLYNNITEFLTHEAEKASFQRRIKYFEIANEILIGDVGKMVRKGEKIMETD